MNTPVGDRCLLLSKSACLATRACRLIGVLEAVYRRRNGLVQLRLITATLPGTIARWLRALFVTQLNSRRCVTQFFTLAREQDFAAAGRAIFHFRSPKVCRTAGRSTSDMRLPNAEQAVVHEAKVRNYLLSPTHPVGRFKATFFNALGFSIEQWPVLRDELLSLAHNALAKPGQPSPFGLKFEIRATVRGPSGRQADIVTVWMVDQGKNFPHFVTAYPG